MITLITHHIRIIVLNEDLPILRKPPAEKGRIQAVLASRDWTESRERAARAPSTPTLAVHSWALPASHLQIEKNLKDWNSETIKHKIWLVGGQNFCTITIWLQRWVGSFHPRRFNPKIDKDIHFTEIFIIQVSCCFCVLRLLHCERFDFVDYQNFLVWRVWHP